MIFRSRRAYSVEWPRKGKKEWGQKVFRTVREARAFALRRLAPNGVKWQIVLVYRPSLLRRVLEARLVWRHRGVPLLPLVVGLAGMYLWVRFLLRGLV